ncbi:MAG: hypothetical protein H7Y18_08030 [Clostridiaceae bacterium]|nr:hypothetical protein [Clostridiaceae bacterium]
MRNKSKSINNSIQELAYEEQIEENGICELPVTGIPVAQFSFANDSSQSDAPMIKKADTLSSDLTGPLELKDKKVMNINDISSKRTYAYGITPPVNGEYFDTRRSFSFRKSTVRMLNELKAADPDINIYLNSIVDRALRHYYEYVIKEKDSENQNISH